MTTDFEQRIDRASALVKEARKVVAFSGAGISTESGLTDFRSAGGLWERFRTVTYQEFLESEEGRIEYWRMRRELIPALLEAEPNRAHRALARLQELDKLAAVVTQNIDGLHQAAGCDPVIELHGTNMSASCLSCRRRWPIAAILEKLEAGETAPRCPECDGLIKPDTVSFGQSMPQKAMNAAFEHARSCDLMLVIGSSLEVQPAALVPVEAAEAGAELLFFNRTPTPYDDLAAVRFEEQAGEALSAVVDAVEDADEGFRG